MHYQISRNGQTYGPYTLDDLRRYVTSGNVLLTDLAKSDDPAQTDWLPVSQILNPQPPAAPPFSSQPAAAFDQPYQPLNTPDTAPQAPQPAFPQTYTQPYQQQAFQANPGLAASAYPDPPNLHWGLVLLFTFLTCGIFGIIWDFVQAIWVRRVEPTSKALFFYLAAVILTIIRTPLVIANAVSRVHGTGFSTTTILGGLLGIAAFTIWIIGRFSLRASLERHFNGPEPIGLRLSGVMTFFFGQLYFQYHFNRINAMKQAARIGMSAPRY